MLAFIDCNTHLGRDQLTKSVVHLYLLQDSENVQSNGMLHQYNVRKPSYVTGM